MSESFEKKARYFLEYEKQFQLGFLPTEQSNPKTKNLDINFMENICKGLRQLFSVDYDIVPVADRIMSSLEFQKLVRAMEEAIFKGHRVIISGCGATGRLAILLETMWRQFFIELKGMDSELYRKLAAYENSVFSIMTGGDYALIRSVESFEDYESFGRRQVKDMNVSAGDLILGITEGGETSSVLGTLAEGLERGASVFLAFNNPAELLSSRLERSGKIISDPRVTVLDLYCGPMALSGSTRMQATSSELLVAGAALENCLQVICQKNCGGPLPAILQAESCSWAAEFRRLVDELSTPESLAVLADYVKFEEKIYREGGLVTYFADKLLLDTFTDTTERAPIFMLPPFRKNDDKNSLPSWAFVKNPLLPTPETWRAVLGRAPRCLEWSSSDYMEMGSEQKIIDNPPRLSVQELFKFEIGNEVDSVRASSFSNAAVMLAAPREINQCSARGLEDAFQSFAGAFREQRFLVIGKSASVISAFQIPCRIARSPLRLMERMAAKLVLNSISTGTMVRLGRVSGNWMSFVEVSNKKLVDRSIRLVSELCGLDYDKACYELFKSLDEIEQMRSPVRISPAQHTIARLGRTEIRK